MTDTGQSGHQSGQRPSATRPVFATDKILGYTPPLDGTPPPVTVTINQAASQADPTTVGPILFTVVFSVPVTGFTIADVAISGTSGATNLVATLSGSGAVYTVTVNTATLVLGSVIANIPAGGAASTANGLLNQLSTSTDNVVTYGAGPLTVTVNQAAGQADPTSTSPILFTAVFSRSTSNFTSADVTITGTAGATEATVTEIAPFDGTTYEVSVPMVGPMITANYDWNWADASTITLDGSNRPTQILDLIIAEELATSLTSLGVSPAAYPGGTQNGLNYCSSGSTPKTGATLAVAMTQPFGVEAIWRTSSLAPSTNYLFSFVGATGSIVEFSNTVIINAGTDLVGPASDTSWHHWYFEFNGTSSKIYRDGVLTTTGNAGANGMTGLIEWNNSAGNSTGQSQEHGRIRLISGTRTATEISDSASYLMDLWGI